MTTAEGGDLIHRWWLVAFLDLLGQQDAFLKTDVMPGHEDRDATRALIAAINDSIGVIGRFQQFTELLTIGRDVETLDRDWPAEICLVGLPLSPAYGDET
jgi:hypothetical protein